LWDSGNGQMGNYFVCDDKGLYQCRKLQENVPYRDD